MAFEAFAGAEPETLPPGTVAYIGTGGPLPEGADAVVQIEDTLDQGADDRGQRLVKILVEVPGPGYDVRQVGRHWSLVVQGLQGRIVRAWHARMRSPPHVCLIE